MEQCNFTGGRESSFAIIVFLMLAASSRVMPFTSSVAKDEDAMAEPQPNVLNLTSSITPVSSLTLICNLITSPQAGAPTSPVPTFLRFLSIVPTFLGFW
ncbi:hypothetical protein OGATHE_002449 [Ogataea polymorpha]|uniref:Uncharacterized protein n=1 Tax=Ogataea polymorpha TaxID=460523 RepID=A0A9P8PD32_9ASCO|nr:hypothetical protein OGATHE_002449 [Ogataea polymorpha]